RTAIKDVGRVLDIPFADVDRITKLIPTTLNIKLKEAMQQEPAIEEVARKVEGMARNSGMHAAGVVISPVPLRELVPLCKTSKDEIVTQYDMVGLEKLALLKMDFLGLTTLDIIQEAVALIEQYHGVKLDTEKLPLD